MPELDNPDQVLREVTNEDLAPGIIEMKIEANQLCLGRDLSMKLTFRGREDVLPSYFIEIGKQP